MIMEANSRETLLKMFRSEQVGSSYRDVYFAFISIWGKLEISELMRVESTTNLFFFFNVDAFVDLHPAMQL